MVSATLDAWALSAVVRSSSSCPGASRLRLALNVATVRTSVVEDGADSASVGADDRKHRARGRHAAVATARGFIVESPSSPWECV